MLNFLYKPLIYSACPFLRRCSKLVLLKNAFEMAYIVFMMNSGGGGIQLE